MAPRTSLSFHGREIARGQLGDWFFSMTSYERASAIPLHAHDSPYATVVMRGAYEETFAGTSRQCRAGSIVVHAMGERHADVFAGATTCLNIHGGRFDTSNVIAPSSAAGLAAKFRREFLQPDAFSAQIIEALMLEVDALSHRSGANDDRAPLWLRDVRRLLEANFLEPLTLSTLAAGAGIHPTHLARSFRRHYGMTVGELVRERRMQHARKQLRAGRSLAEIASEAGFADQSHFTRVFRKATGMTPAAFRRKNLTD